jgi:hypothetical protein
MTTTMTGGIGTYEVLRRLGITSPADIAVINRWVAAEVITPSLTRGIGSGHRSRWSEFDVERLRALFEVRANFHAREIDMPYSLAGEIWEALGEGRTWDWTVRVDLPA